MLDLDRMARIRLSARPFAQRFVANTFLRPNYELSQRVTVGFQGEDRIPREPVIFAMNHTDRFNYWPFQYALYKRHRRYTATWVKGKYYETALVGFFMEKTNNIPTVSRGFLITKDFVSTVGRRPTNEEYAALRDAVNAVAHGLPEGAATLDPSLPEPLLRRPRNMLGRRFDPSRESYPFAIDALYRAMMRRFVALNEDADRLGLDLLIFPQGTRSLRLSKGHIGLAQIAMHLDRAVVPVGCNGSDKLYPRSSPVAQRGVVNYRFGDPVWPHDAAAWVDRGTFEPFTEEAEAEHGEAFQRYVDDLMDRIDPLLDPEYRFSTDAESEGVTGSDRFV